MAAAKKTAPEPTPKGKRLVVDLSEEMHRKLKLKATAEGLSIRDYVLALLKEKGID
jgi:predicted DNA binding CopG/RHH family protein